MVIIKKKGTPPLSGHFRSQPKSICQWMICKVSCLTIFYPLLTQQFYIAVILFLIVQLVVSHPLFLPLRQDTLSNNRILSTSTRLRVLKVAYVTSAALNVASTRFKADKGIMDALVHLRNKTGAGGRGGATARESVLMTPLWGMLYGDDAEVVSQSPEQPRKIMGVIVVVCAVFGLTASEAKTEIMCLHAKEMPESTAAFSVEAADQEYNQTNEFIYLGRKRQPQCRTVHRGRPAHTQRMVQLPEVHPQTVRPTERSPRAQNPEAKSRGTRDNAVRLRHVKPTRVPLRRVAPSPPQVLHSLYRLAKSQSCRPPDFLSGHAYQDGK